MALLVSSSVHQSLDRGQTLVEILVAMGISLVLLPALFVGMHTSRSGKAQEQQRLLAMQYINEASEALSSVAERSWSNVTMNGTFYPTNSSSQFNLQSGSETINGFNRQIVLSDVYRNASGSVVTSGTLDPSTKRAVTTVSWNTPMASSLTQTQFLTRYLANAALTHTTQSDFSSGTFSNTQATGTGGGAVELRSATASAMYTEPFTTAANYTFDTNKIEVTGGFAQLKNVGTAASGGTVNPAFTLNLLNWTFAQFGNNASQTGALVLSGGNPGGFAQINFPAQRNLISGGYFYQPFTTTVANPSATLTFNWRVSGYDNHPDNLRLFAYVDTSTAAPVSGQHVWDSGNLLATSAWSGNVSVNVGSKITTAGTYYLKLVAYVDYPSATKGPYTVGFDNAQLSWSGVSGTSYASDSPTIFPTTSLQPGGLVSWNSFAAIEVPNGGSVRYQLSNDDGTTWLYYNSGSNAWQTATLSTQYNTAVEVNTRIGTFPKGAGRLRVRAFLIGNLKREQL